MVLVVLVESVAMPVRASGPPVAAVRAVRVVLAALVVQAPQAASARLAAMVVLVAPAGRPESAVPDQWPAALVQVVPGVWAVPAALVWLVPRELPG